jgi:hypothetical protein
MSLSECLTAALANNLDLAIAKKDPKIADLNVMFQKAAFDPVLGAEARHTAKRTDDRITTTLPPNHPVSTTASSKAINDAHGASRPGRDLAWLLALPPLPIWMRGPYGVLFASAIVTVSVDPSAYVKGETPSVMSIVVTGSPPVSAPWTAADGPYAPNVPP